MTVMALSADSQAITLLCSALALPRGAGIKPLSPTDWSSLAATIHRSDLQRPGALLGLDQDALRRELEVSADAARRMATLLARGGQLALELDHLAGRGIWVITRADETYPPLLKERLKATAPPLLFGAGQKALLRKRAIAVVGSRHADENSLSFAALIGSRCAQAGITVVSGAARGVDAAAMIAAADAGGNSVGFVADALEKMARRQDVREHLIEGGIALASPYHPAARFTVGNAMRRNRLIYCLSEAAVVVAAAGENGGTRGGALENLKAGWVPLFVRADQDAPAGNRDLLAGGGLPLRRDELEDPEAIESLLSRATAESAAQATFDDLPAEQLRSEPDAEPRPPTLTEDAATRGEDRRPETRSLKNSRRDRPEPTASKPDDLFTLVWPRLAQFLSEPRSEREVADSFGLEIAQARAWLKRAVTEGLAERLERQRRYCVRTARPQELFPPTTAQERSSS
jgi:predicted Rossmann fold nucleotide-binding protein DprA/Smf involved in DNA uptake